MVPHDGACGGGWHCVACDSRFRSARGWQWDAFQTDLQPVVGCADLPAAQRGPSVRCAGGAGLVPESRPRAHVASACTSTGGHRAAPTGSQPGRDCSSSSNRPASCNCPPNASQHALRTAPTASADPTQRPPAWSSSEARAVATAVITLRRCLVLESSVSTAFVSWPSRDGSRYPFERSRRLCTARVRPAPSPRRRKSSRRGLAVQDGSRCRIA